MESTEHLWTVLRGDILSRDQHRSFACWCAEQAAHILNESRHDAGLATENAIACAKDAARTADKSGSGASTRDATGLAAEAIAWDSIRDASVRTWGDDGFSPDHIDYAVWAGVKPAWKSAKATTLEDFLTYVLATYPEAARAFEPAVPVVRRDDDGQVMNCINLSPQPEDVLRVSAALKRGETVWSISGGGTFGDLNPFEIAPTEGEAFEKISGEWYKNKAVKACDLEKRGWKLTLVERDDPRFQTRNQRVLVWLGRWRPVRELGTPFTVSLLKGRIRRDAAASETRFARSEIFRRICDGEGEGEIIVEGSSCREGQWNSRTTLHWRVGLMLPCYC